MADKNVSISYDSEGDMIEVLWEFREGYFSPTDDDRVLKRLDDSGEVIGFLLHGVSTLRQDGPIEFELAPEDPDADVANLTVRLAARDLGISEQRVRKLARAGRIRGAVQHGGRWLIPTPVEVTPARHAPVPDSSVVTADEAARERGVSGRRLRQLARDGRVRGAVKQGWYWRIPSPVELVPARRGPVGIAGRASSSSGTANQPAEGNMTMAAAHDDAPPTLPDILLPGLDVVFVGLNPAKFSAQQGHYYSGPRNRFWRWLSDSPLVDRELGPDDDGDLPGSYGIGLTDVLKLVETDSANVAPAAHPDAVLDFRRRIAAAAPSAVCFNGAEAFKAVFPGRWESYAWGPQNVTLGDSEVWVMPMSSGVAAGSHKYAADVLAELAEALSRGR